MEADPARSIEMEIAFFATVAVAGVLTAGLLAGLETGMYRLSRVRLSIRASRGDRGAQRLAAEYARPRRLLATLLVANAIAGWFASFGTSQVFDALGYGVVTAVILDLVVLVPVVFLFGEVLPKDLFRVHADRYMPRYAGLLVLLRRLLCWTGVVPLVAGIGSLAARIFGKPTSEDSIGSRARVASLLAEGVGSQGLSEAQLGFADRVFTMRGITVGQEMRPWREVASIPISASPAERARVFGTSGSSRLPVVEPSGRVVGLVSAIDQMGRSEEPTSGLLRTTLIVSPATPALEVIGLMRRERLQLVIVAENPEKPLGIATMKDLVEPLVGDLAAW